MEFAWNAPQPVPPFVVGRIPVMSVAREMSDVETDPAVALRKPERLAMVSEFEAMRTEVDAYVAVMLVVEALVIVARGDVSVPAASIVVEAVPPKNASVEENCVDDARPLNCWSAVQVLALVRFNPSVPVVVIGPPVSVASVATLVTVPAFAVRQTPPTDTQPEVSSIPATVDVAVALKRVARTPKAKDDVAVVEVEVM